MIEVLFNGKDDITYEDVVKRLTYYIHEANEGLRLNKDNRKQALELARQIRKKLEKEYKHNSSQRISKFYEDNIYFEGFYKPAVHEAIASITGPLSYDSLVGFLNDVDYYMNYYIPTKK